MLVTSPDYLGRCADLGAISGVCKARGALLLVDGAHGAHFALSAALPESPGARADLWVASAHKTLPCPNQGAYLFGNGAKEADRLKDALFMVHTTSPSFLLLCALDSAWRTAREWDYGGHIARLDAVRGRIAALGGLDPYPKDRPAVFDTDKTRLVISVSGRGITGYEADVHLQGAGVFAEMADAQNLVAITSPLDPDDWYERLVLALSSLPKKPPLVFCEPVLPAFPKRCCRRGTPRFSTGNPFPFPKRRKDLRGKLRRLPARCAAAAPGELIDEECAGFVLSACAKGGALFGVTGGRVQVIMDGPGNLPQIRRNGE